jgi:hypothetical protein
MPAERKAVVVYHDPAARGEHPSLEELNRLLLEGWLPIHATGMGGAAAGAPAGADVQAGFAALVILQREKDYAVAGFGR